MTGPTPTVSSSLYRTLSTAASLTAGTARGTATITESIEQSDSDDATIANLGLLSVDI